MFYFVEIKDKEGKWHPADMNSTNRRLQFLPKGKLDFGHELKAKDVRVRKCTECTPSQTCPADSPASWR